MAALSDPRFLNLLFSAVILVGGLFCYWVLSPSLFKQAAFAEAAFEIWLLKWLVYLMTWGLLGKSPDLRWVLATVDLNNVLTIAFVLVFYWGNEYANKKLLLNLTFLFGLLFSWNFVSFAWAASFGHPEWWISWGLKPSMVASTGSIASMAVLYIWRYRSSGIMFAVMSCGYVILQLPAYRIIFESPAASKGSSTADWLLWLAIGKLLYAVTFYGSFFTRLPDTSALQIPSAFPQQQRPRLRKAFTFVALAIGSGILTSAGELIGKLLLKKLGA